MTNCVGPVCGHFRCLHIKWYSPFDCGQQPVHRLLLHFCTIECVHVIVHVSVCLLLYVL